MRLYIIRHADPDYPGGTITPAGHKEAQALAERLVQERIDRIYSSPRGRAVHTAEYTADRLGLSIEVQKWMQELDGLKLLDGPHAGKVGFALDGHLLRDGRAGQNGDGSLHPLLNQPGFAEIVEQVRRDSDRFLAEMGYVRAGGVYRVTADNRDRVAVFCHGGLGLTWLAHLLDVPVVTMWASFWLAPSSVTVVPMDEREQGIATPRCLCMGDTSHLHVAGLSTQPAMMRADWD